MKPTETLLLISGPVGVGKSSVGDELSTLLEQRGVPHTLVDLDALAMTFPRTTDDPYGDRIALKNLSVVWQNARAAGSKNLIIPRVVETPAYIGKVAASVSIDAPVTCRLTASDDTLLARIQSREIGSNLDWHRKRSLHLSRSLAEVALEDFSVQTDNRTVTDIASEIERQVIWHS